MPRNGAQAGRGMELLGGACRQAPPCRVVGSFHCLCRPAHRSFCPSLHVGVAPVPLPEPLTWLCAAGKRCSCVPFHSPGHQPLQDGSHLPRRLRARAPGQGSVDRGIGHVGRVCSGHRPRARNAAGQSARQALIGPFSPTPPPASRARSLFLCLSLSLIVSPSHSLYRTLSLALLFLLSCCPFGLLVRKTENGFRQVWRRFINI